MLSPLEEVLKSRSIHSNLDRELEVPLAGRQWLFICIRAAFWYFNR